MYRANCEAQPNTVQAPEQNMQVLTTELPYLLARFTRVEEPGQRIGNSGISPLPNASHWRKQRHSEIAAGESS